MQDLRLKTIQSFMEDLATLPKGGGYETLSQINQVDAWGFPQFVHHLKTLSEYFQAVVDDRKFFEIRKNDRDFRVGEFLCLWEFDGSKYSDRAVLVSVPYILRPCPVYGLVDNHCIMSIKIITERLLEG